MVQPGGSSHRSIATPLGPRGPSWPAVPTVWCTMGGNDGLSECGCAAVGGCPGLLPDLAQVDLDAAEDARADAFSANDGGGVVTPAQDQLLDEVSIRVDEPELAHAAAFVAVALG